MKFFHFRNSLYSWKIFLSKKNVNNNNKMLPYNNNSNKDLPLDSNNLKEDPLFKVLQGPWEVHPKELLNKCQTYRFNNLYTSNNLQLYLSNSINPNQVRLWVQGVPWDNPLCLLELFYTKSDHKVLNRSNSQDLNLVLLEHFLYMTNAQCLFNKVRIEEKLIKMG